MNNPANHGIISRCVETLLSQDALYEGFNIFVAHRDRDLVSVLGIDDCLGVAAVFVDLLCQATCLAGISTVVICAVQDERGGLDMWRNIKD